MTTTNVRAVAANGASLDEDSLVVHGRRSPRLAAEQGLSGDFRSRGAGLSQTRDMGFDFTKRTGA